VLGQLTAPTGNPLTVQISIDTCSSGAGYLGGGDHDSQLEEGKTPGCHVMGNNANVTLDTLS
jgi:hypothetical protein